jgi:hypothetical protein
MSIFVWEKRKERGMDTYESCSMCTGALPCTLPPSCTISAYHDDGGAATISDDVYWNCIVSMWKSIRGIGSVDTLVLPGNHDTTLLPGIHLTCWPLGVGVEK